MSTLGGMALPPTPIRWQSIRSPSSRNDSLPTTTPFSDATTACKGLLLVVQGDYTHEQQPSMHSLLLKVLTSDHRAGLILCTPANMQHHPRYCRSCLVPAHVAMTALCSIERKCHAWCHCSHFGNSITESLQDKVHNHLKKFDICVEQVTLCDVDTLEAQLMYELQNASCDYSLSAGASASKWPLRSGVLEDNPVELWDINLIPL